MTQSDRKRLLDAFELQAFKDFAECQISYEQMLNILADAFRVKYDGRVRSFELFFDDSKSPFLLITKDDLERALGYVRDGTMSEDDLSNWATFILLFDVYGFEEKDNDLIVEWLNDLSRGIKGDS